MPLLVLWTSAVALLGGMLGLAATRFVAGLFSRQSAARRAGQQPVHRSRQGLVFGFVIAVVACHFGLHVKPNTESLSANTTSAVVTAITTVILVDAIFAVFTRHIGVPQL
jgi:phospholipid/cholesterol/gamma-HCH transport system permease protein